MAKAFSGLLVIVGLALLATALFPVVSYELFAFANLRQRELLSPVPGPQVRGTSAPYPPNLTRARNWFVGAPELKEEAPLNIRFYNVSIPKLKIEDAVAEIGGDDLSKSLIHYKGTALPGRVGNTVIFGHSTLPFLFNPRNYLSIFSTLPTIKIDDEVKINYDGIVYTYRIEEIYEVGPRDIQVLEQRYDDSYITLITCVPPGTYLKRLVVKGRLVPSSN